MSDPVAIETAAPKSLNIKKGLTRLFVVFAVCWYIGSGLYVWPRWSNYFYELADADRKPIADPLLAKFRDSRTDDNLALLSRFVAYSHRPTELTAWLVLIPVGVYGLGMGIFWIVRGFRSAPGGSGGLNSKHEAMQVHPSTPLLS